MTVSIFINSCPCLVPLGFFQCYTIMRDSKINFHMHRFLCVQFYCIISRCGISSNICVYIIYVSICTYIYIYMYLCICAHI